MLLIWSHPDTCRVRPSAVSFPCTASLRSYVTPKYLTAGVAIPYQLHLLFFEGYWARATPHPYVVYTCGFTQNWMIRWIPIAHVLYRIRS